MDKREEFAELVASKINQKSTKEKIEEIEMIGKVNRQLRKEKRYYVVSLSFLCLVLTGLLFWSLVIKDQDHVFDCEIVVKPKEDGQWL